jgi:predicted Fe-Mo cluster-binding NifX family protein
LTWKRKKHQNVEGRFTRLPNKHFADLQASGVFPGGGMKFRIAVPSKAGVPIFDLHKCSEISIVDIDAGRLHPIETASVDTKDGDRLSGQLEAKGVDILVAGGVGPEILDRLNHSRINLVTGVHGKTVEGLVAAFLDGSLSTPSHTDGRMPAE